MSEPIGSDVYRDLITRALAEDVGDGDITTRAIAPGERRARGTCLAKSGLVVAGLPVMRDVFLAVDPEVVVEPIRRDGDWCERGATLARVIGRAASLLTAERTALNFLQYMSGIATLTRAYVEAAGDRLEVLDTRKTTPGLRALAKYAVRCGGGVNHRAGLFDALLVKDNHIQVAGGIAEAVRRARAARHGPVEVETETLAQVDEALAAGADIIMLDNFDDARTATAIARIAHRARVELSGTMTLDRVRRLAGCGADCVSIGALTHSAAAADISLEIVLESR